MPSNGGMASESKTLYTSTMFDGVHSKPGASKLRLHLRSFFRRAGLEG